MGDNLKGDLLGLLIGHSKPYQERDKQNLSGFSICLYLNLVSNFLKEVSFNQEAVLNFRFRSIVELE
jgi:hypothetical protein